MKRESIVGMKYGKLTVVEQARKRTPAGLVQWKAVCDCGGTKIATRTNLKSGKTKSCGCIRFQSGEDSPHAQRCIKKYGVWVPKNSSWYMRASGARQRAQKQGIPFGFESVLDFAVYLNEIDPQRCPVFGKPLYTGEGKQHDWSPSIDKIDPMKGYVRGNIQIISKLANTMKQDATPKQLVQFALWVLRTHGEKFGYAYKHI